jgi:hypothetical protein
MQPVPMEKIGLRGAMLACTSSWWTQERNEYEGSTITVTAKKLQGVVWSKMITGDNVDVDYC